MALQRACYRLPARPRCHVNTDLPTSIYEITMRGGGAVEYIGVGVVEGNIEFAAPELQFLEGTVAFVGHARTRRTPFNRIATLLIGTAIALAHTHVSTNDFCHSRGVDPSYAGSATAHNL
jgi:hypothetical protein